MRAARAVALALALALPAFGAHSGAVDVRYEVGLFSDYVWRGIALTNDPVLQPSVTLAHASGLSFELWGNADLGDDNDTAGEINEARLVLDYGRKWGEVEVGAGLIEYLFPNTPFPGTREVYLRAGIDALVSPKLEIFYDVDEIDGGYALVSLAWERELQPLWSCAIELSAGFADAAFAIGGEAGPHDGNVEIRVERSTPAFDLTLLGGWTGSLDSDVLLDQPTDLWTGVAVAFRLPGSEKTAARPSRDPVRVPTPVAAR